MHTTAMQSILIASLPVSVVVLAPAGDEQETRANTNSSFNDHELANRLRSRFGVSEKRKRLPSTRPRVSVLSASVSAPASPQSGKSTGTPAALRHKTETIMDASDFAANAAAPTPPAAAAANASTPAPAAAVAVGAHAAFDSDVQTGAAAYDQVPAVRPAAAETVAGAPPAEKKKQQNQTDLNVIEQRLKSAWNLLLPGRSLPSNNCRFTGSKFVGEYSKVGRQKDMKAWLGPLVVALLSLADEERPGDVLDLIASTRGMQAAHSETASVELSAEAKMIMQQAQELRGSKRGSNNKDYVAKLSLVAPWYRRKTISAFLQAIGGKHVSKQHFAEARRIAIDGALGEGRCSSVRVSDETLRELVEFVYSEDNCARQSWGEKEHTFPSGLHS